MSELGSGSGTSYPTSLDTDDILEVNSPNVGKTRARAEVVNDLASAIVAIESELGTSPKGTAANVKTFLQTQHNLNGTHKTISTDTLSATGQITSTLATGTAPFVVASTTEVANLRAATATTATTADKINDGTNLIHTKIIEIGDWNMDTTTYIEVTHGLALSKIRGVSAIIRSDNGLAHTPLVRCYSNTNGTMQGHVVGITGTTVALQRLDGGVFDSASYSATSYNRGWITITYVE